MRPTQIFRESEYFYKIGTLVAVAVGIGVIVLLVIL